MEDSTECLVIEVGAVEIARVVCSRDLGWVGVARGCCPSLLVSWPPFVAATDLLIY